jgi:hypothetical protein
LTNARKPVSRFLPTLTEVVVPVSPAPGWVLDQEVLVARVLETLIPELEDQVRAVMLELAQQHADEAMVRLQMQMEVSVRAAVAQAIAKAASIDP